MLNRDEIATRLSTYIDKEIMPKLDTKGKWVIGTYMTIAMYRMPHWIQSILDNPMLSALGIEDENGLVHMETVVEALDQTAQKYGKLTLDVPLLGSMTFDHTDVQKLKEYML